MTDPLSPLTSSSPTATLDLSLKETDVKPVPVLVPLGDGNFKLRVDNSTNDIIKSCPREGSFYLLHRRGRGTSPAMNMGSAIHKALEFLYRNGFSNENLTTSYSLIEQHYQLFPIVDEWRTPEFAKNVMLEYFTKVGSGPFEILTTPEGNTFVEKAFEIELGEVEVNDYLPYSYEQLTGEPDPTGLTNQTYIKTLKIYIIGKIDVGVRQLGGIWAFDHKTASRLGETFWAKWPISPQMKTYCWALWKIFGEVPMGAILNVLVVRKPTRTGTSIDFQRQSFQYPEETLREWEHNTLLSVSNFVAMAVQDEFPPNDANCIRIYGKCPYYDVCALPKASRLPYLYTSVYAPVTWDPTSEK